MLDKSRIVYALEILALVLIVGYGLISGDRRGYYVAFGALFLWATWWHTGEGTLQLPFITIHLGRFSSWVGVGLGICLILWGLSQRK
jgi:hypothetical protein